MIFIHCDVMQKQLQDLTKKGEDLRDYMIVDCDEDNRSAIIVNINDHFDSIIDNSWPE